MNIKKKMTGVRAIALAAVMVSSTAALAGPVSVKVREIVGTGGTTTYSYRLENRTAQPVVGLKLGFDRASGEPLLQTPPLGWTLDGGLPSSSATSPAGWSARVIVTEETNGLEVEWSSDGNPQFDIAAGATATGFSVKVAQPAPEYRATLVDVLFGNGTSAWAFLELDNTDTTPPSLNVQLDPMVIWPPDRKMVTVSATITVSDNADPNPRVRLVSITANETLEPTDIDGAALGTDDRQFSLRAIRLGQQTAGRIYTVTYSATDASGNTATTAATVVVPHDQRP